jgi:hypothetical protein
MIATQRLLLMGAVAVCPAILAVMDAVVHLITYKRNHYYGFIIQPVHAQSIGEQLTIDSQPKPRNQTKTKEQKGVPAYSWTHVELLPASC